MTKIFKIYFKLCHFDLVQNSTGGPDVIDLPDDTDTTDDDGPPPTPVPELLVLTGDLDNADGSEATQLYSATQWKQCSENK